MTKTLRTIALSIVGVAAIAVLLALVHGYATDRNAESVAIQATSEPQCGYVSIKSNESPSDAIVRVVKELRDVGAFGPGALVDLDNAQEAGRQWLINAHAGTEGIPAGSITTVCATNLHVTEVGGSELD